MDYRTSTRNSLGLPTLDHCDHTLTPMGHTREFLEERGRGIKAPTARINYSVKAWRTIEHSLLAHQSESNAPMSRQWLREKVLREHVEAVARLEDAMTEEAFAAVMGIDDWLLLYCKEPQTHGVRINRDTFIDNDRIRSRVSAYVYRLA